jgi:hypothetical protein
VGAVGGRGKREVRADHSVLKPRSTKRSLNIELMKGTFAQAELHIILDFQN